MSNDVTYLFCKKNMMVKYSLKFIIIYVNITFVLKSFYLFFSFLFLSFLVGKDHQGMDLKTMDFTFHQNFNKIIIVFFYFKLIKWRQFKTIFSRFFWIKFLLSPVNLKEKKQNWFYFVRLRLTFPKQSGKK